MTQKNPAPGEAGHGAERCVMTHVSALMPRVVLSIAERALAFHRTEAQTAPSAECCMYHRKQAAFFARRRDLLIQRGT